MAKSPSTGFFEIPKSTENLSSNPQIYRFKMAKSPSTALLEIPKSTENLGTNPQIYSQILAKSPVYRKTSPPPKEISQILIVLSSPKCEHIYFVAISTLACIVAT